MKSGSSAKAVSGGLNRRSPGSITRRDFLKAAGTLPLGLGLGPLLAGQRPGAFGAGARQNILIILFDALSARHLSFHGYARQTTPNLARLIDRAVVYHNHHATGNFTSPGTASLLTGTLPWTHRALIFNARVEASHTHKTIFQALPQHHRIAYSHNPLANTLCRQFEGDLDEHIPLNRLLLTNHGLYDDLFAGDQGMASTAWVRTMRTTSGAGTYSLFMPPFRSAYLRQRLAPLLREFPKGVPEIGGAGYFLLEDAIDWLQTKIGQLPQPFLGYFHLMPPHERFCPPREFYERFAHDDFVADTKQPHPLVDPVVPDYALISERAAYDEFTLYADREFGRLFAWLESSGILDNTWVILTSDHGQMFERGFLYHGGPLLFEPLIHVPLIIFEPGRQSRLDVHAPTSAVDLLPTLLNVAAQDVPSWAEGSLLPPFGQPERGRSVLALSTDTDDPLRRLTQATAAVLKDGYKLTYMFGYPALGAGGERVELYDLGSDPEESFDLSALHPETVEELLRELKEKLRVAESPYA